LILDYNKGDKKVSTAATSPDIEIRLNGEPFSLPRDSTVADLLRRLELVEDRVAIELDRRILPRPQWIGQRLAPGAAIEIVQIVGGG